MYCREKTLCECTRGVDVSEIKSCLKSMLCMELITYFVLLPVCNYNLLLFKIYEVRFINVAAPYFLTRRAGRLHCQ